VVQVKMSKVK